MTRCWLPTALATLVAGSPCFAQAQQATPGTPVPTAGSDYVDRVMDDGPPSAAEPDTAEVQADTGWPHSLSAELQSWRQDGLGKVRNQSLQLAGRIDTPDYGALSFNVNVNRWRNEFVGTSGLGLPTSSSYLGAFRNSNTGRIDQRAMPFDGGWLLHNSLGDINTVGTPMSRGLGRVYLPTLPIEGLATTFEKPGRTQFNLAAGRLGYFDGIDFQGFSLTRGTAVGGGVQQQLSGGEGPLALNRTDAAFQWVSTRRFDVNGQVGSPQDTDSFWGAFAWQGLAPWADSLGPGFGALSERPGGMRVQANVAHSSGRPSDPLSSAARDSANGAWIDAQWRGDWLQQAASVFYFDPALRWGSNPIAGDLRGASWRGDVSTRQWQLGGSAELSESVSGLSGRSLFANLFGRWRFDSRDAVSATLAGRTGTFAAQSLQLAWEHQSSWGQTQWRADAAHGRDTRIVRLGVDHTWNVGEAATLSTSLGVERSDLDGSSGSTTGLQYGVLGSLPFGAGARLDLGLRGTHRLSGGGDATPFLNASARVSWPLGGGWSLIAQYTAVRGQESLSPQVVSALTTATQAPVLNLPSNRTLLVALRWEMRGGTARAPIGGMPGMGAGRVEGHVYFDQNGNGVREANEGGVPGVTVMLNQRYVARTDAQGFYSFPQVAAGRYQVEVVPDNVPLPWGVAPREARAVEVFVRDTARADFALQRDR